MFGQLYPAVMIARLISLELVGRRRPAPGGLDRSAGKRGEAVFVRTDVRHEDDVGALIDRTVEPLRLTRRRG